MTFWEKYKSYVGKHYTVVFYMSIPIAFINFIVGLVEMGNSGDAGTAIAMFMFSGLFVGAGAIITTAIYGTIALVVMTIPVMVYFLTIGD